MELFEILLLAGLGLATGVFGGMLGVGGSIVMIPALAELLGSDQHLYQATAMIVNFFVVVPAAWQHHRAKAISGATVLRMVPTAIVAVVVGVALSELPFFSGSGELRLQKLFGLFLGTIVCLDLYRLARESRKSRTAPELDSENRAPRSKPIRIPSWRMSAMVAVPTGLVAGLLGVGGGVLAVPLQRKFMHIPIRFAIANSATIIIATSFIGAIVKNYAQMQPGGRLYVEGGGFSLESFTLAAILGPMAILGSLIGSRLTHRLPVRFIKGAFLLLLMVAATRLLGVRFTG